MTSAAIRSVPSPARPVRVMLVDDSAIVRGMTSKWLEAEPDIEVSAYAADGVQAIKRLAVSPVDVCILDIEMPNMSGLEALPKLLALRPGLKVIMASTLTERGAEVTFKALQLGAADFLPKPSAVRLGAADDYRRDLLAKVRQFARSTHEAAPSPAVRAPAAAPAAPPVARSHVDALVVASSTGGPQALMKLVETLGPRWRTPVLIAQHMPAEFTRTLADMLDKRSPLRVKEAEDGEPISAGTAYVAPGGSHLTVRRSAAGLPTARLDNGPEVNYCRPSADPLFASAADLWRSGLVAAVLTGMGHDGRDGALAVRRSGGHVLAQDEPSSVVWGMPGAVVAAGAADQVLPLSEIGPAIASIAGSSS